MDNDVLSNSEEQNIYDTKKGKGAPTPGFNKMSGIEADPEYAGHSVDERRIRGKMRRNQKR